MIWLRGTCFPLPAGHAQVSLPMITYKIGRDQKETIKNLTVVTGSEELKFGSNFVPTAAGGKRRTLRTRQAPNRTLATDMGLYFGAVGVFALRAWLWGRSQDGGNSTEAAVLYVFRCAEAECWTCQLDTLVCVLSKTQKLLSLEGTAALCSTKSHLLWLMIMRKGRMASIRLCSPCKLRKSRATDIPETLICIKGWHHPHYDDEYISLCVRHIMVFVPHTLKIVTLSGRDTVWVTVRSVGTVPTKARETACGSSLTWSTLWVWMALCVWAALVRTLRSVDHSNQLHLLISASFTFIKLLPSTPEREQKSLLFGN